MWWERDADTQHQARSFSPGFSQMAVSPLTLRKGLLLMSQQSHCLVGVKEFTACIILQSITENSETPLKRSYKKPHTQEGVERNSVGAMAKISTSAAWQRSLHPNTAPGIPEQGSLSLPCQLGSSPVCCAPPGLMPSSCPALGKHSSHSFQHQICQL